MPTNWQFTVPTGTTDRVRSSKMKNEIVGKSGNGFENFYKEKPPGNEELGKPASLSSSFKKSKTKNAGTPGLGKIQRENPAHACKPNYWEWGEPHLEMEKKSGIGEGNRGNSMVRTVWTMMKWRNFLQRIANWEKGWLPSSVAPSDLAGKTQLQKRCKQKIVQR